MKHKRRVKNIKSADAQPCVTCPATGMITYQCWNCELFISGYVNGDIKCCYPYESPLELHLFRIESDTTRWDARYHLRKQDTIHGHQALYEFGKIYDSEIGRVWDTWVRDKSKLESVPDKEMSQNR
jgi:hypothetical protein